jgi:hypothetical protein
MPLDTTAVLTLEVVEAVASSLEEDSFHMEPQAVVCRHCWLLRMSGAAEMKLGWRLRLHARAKYQLLLG